MNGINNFFNSKNYYFFDKSNQLQQRQLNIIQRFFRKVFGCYAETHLLKVVENIYPLTLGAAPNPDVQQILKLIEKANQVYGKAQAQAQAYIQLPQVINTMKMSAKSNANIQNALGVGVRYDLKPADNGNISISSVQFELIFNPNTLSEQAYHISLLKNGRGQLVVKLPEVLFGKDEHDLELAIDQRLNDKRARIIHAFIVKILENSRMDQVRYDAGVYLSKNLNETQKNKMRELGWVYKRSEKQNGRELHAYSLSKNNNLQKNAGGLSCQEQLFSLTFADPLLQRTR